MVLRVAGNIVVSTFLLLSFNFPGKTKSKSQRQRESRLEIERWFATDQDFAATRHSLTEFAWRKENREATLLLPRGYKTTSNDCLPQNGCAYEAGRGVNKKDFLPHSPIALSAPMSAR